MALKSQTLIEALHSSTSGNEMRNLVKSIEVGNKTMKITIVIILNALLDLLLPRRVKI